VQYTLQQYTATHCNTLQHTATHYNEFPHNIQAAAQGLAALRCNTHCNNTLQHTAAHCSTLQHTATHCNTLQHTATRCNTLQHTTTHCKGFEVQHTMQHRPTHSIMYVPLQVNRSKKSILLIVHYKYLQSCSGDFRSPKSDPPHKIMRYWLYYSI